MHAALAAVARPASREDAAQASRWGRGRGGDGRLPHLVLLIHLPHLMVLDREEHEALRVGGEDGVRRDRIGGRGGHGHGRGGRAWRSNGGWGSPFEDCARAFGGRRAVLLPLGRCLFSSCFFFSASRTTIVLKILMKAVTLGMLRGLARRALSVRSSPLQVAGRNGHAHSSRIRPAVGDQAGGFTEAKTRNTSPENDDDWIKIDAYVAKMNPAILDEATVALQRKKWRGEGVQQASFAGPCVGSVSKVTIACTSDDVCARVQAMLAALLGEGLECNGLQFDVQLMGAPWFRSLQSVRKPVDAARMLGLEFAAPIGSSALQKAFKEREIDLTSSHDDGGTYSLRPSGSKPSGLMQQVGLALTKQLEVLPPEFAVRPVESDAPLASVSADSTTDLKVRVKELVIGSEWDEHGPFERFLDRIAGSNGRASLGVWRLPSGPAIRLVPTDDTGLKSLVFYVNNAESALQALQHAGFNAQSFPGYLAVQVPTALPATQALIAVASRRGPSPSRACLLLTLWSGGALAQVGGLDVRLSQEETVDSFYSEVRWEVQDEAQLKSNDDGVSCIGAITHGHLLHPFSRSLLVSLLSSAAQSRALLRSCLHLLSEAHGVLVNHLACHRCGAVCAVWGHGKEGHWILKDPVGHAHAGTVLRRCVRFASSTYALQFISASYEPCSRGFTGPVEN